MTKEKYIERATEYLDSWLESYMIKSGNVGISVSILKGDEIIFSKQMGFANLDTQEQLSNDHIIRFASHSKNITAIAIMQLVEQGKINLSDKLSDYLDFLNCDDETYQKMTLRQVLSHTSGISRDGDDSGFWSLYHSFPTKEDLKQFFATSNAVIENNTYYKYTNFGYSLLGLLIEELTGESYIDYIQKNLFDKLGLSHIYMEFDANKKNITGHAHKSHIGRFTTLEKDFKANGLAPAGGICATTESMCKFYKNLFDNTLLSDESKKEMFRVQADIQKTSANYGLGFRLIDIEDDKLVGHNGGFPGQISSTFISPAKNLVVSVAVNDSSGPAFEILSTVYNIINFFEKNKQKLEKQDFEKFKGGFFNCWGERIYTPVGDNIYVTSSFMSPFNSASLLEHKVDNIFKVMTQDATGSYAQDVEFEFDNNDNLEKVKFSGSYSYKREDYINKFIKK